MKTDDKVRENYVRRWAARLGLFLRKSRARKFNIEDRGGYRIEDPGAKTTLAGEKFELDIDQVEHFLQLYEKKLIN